MKLIQHFSKLAYAQSAIGMAAYGLATQNVAVVLVAVTLCAISWSVVESSDGRPLPRWLINAAVAVVTIWLFYTQMVGYQPLIYNLGLYILFLQLCKLYERKTNRDWAQLIVLSLMQMICGSIVSNRVSFAVVLVLYLMLAMVTVMALQFKVGHDAAGGRPGFGMSDVQRRLCRHQFQRLATLCGVFCLVIGWAVFVFVPRGTGAGFFGRSGGEGQRNVSGFTNQIELTSNTRIEPSEVPVMHVSLERNGKPVGSNGEGLLLRGMVLDRYDPITRRWDRGNTKYTDWALSTHFPEGLLAQIGSDEVAAAPRLVQHVTLRGATHGVLFSTRAPLQIKIDRPNTVTFNPHDQVFRLQRPSGAVNYMVESIEVDPGAPGLMYRTPPGWQSLGWESYARGPVLADPRLAQLAQTVLAQANLTRDPALLDDPEDHRRAAVIEDYLRNNYVYDLQLGSARSDPMLAFLFEHRRGHCEYFASAMCALLRSVGMRARMISGFSASEHNAVGGYYVVRQKNAHAWIEVWANGGGWRAFDPSPPGDVAAIHRAGGGMLAGVRDLYEYMEFYWINSVIRYDNEQRQGVMAGLRDRVKTATSWGREQFDQWLAWLRQAGWMQVLFLITVAATAGLSLAAAWQEWMQRRTLRRLGIANVRDRSHRRRLAGELAFYARMMGRLRAMGHERAPGQTPAAFAREVAAEDPHALGAVIPLTELYYAVRFGGRELDDAQAQRARDWLAALGRPVS